MDKNKDPFEGADLMLRYLRGELSPEQEAVFFQWLEQDIRNGAFLNTVLNEDLLSEEIDFFDAIDTDQQWLGLVQKANEAPEIMPWWQKNGLWKYAAVIGLLCLSALSLYQAIHTKNKAALIAAAPQPIPHDVKPGGDKAILTLADGTKLALDEAADGVLRASKELTILKKNGQVVYRFSGQAAAAPVKYNTISTPKGGQYQLVLPDGTRVWLNAASSLRFPTAFTGPARQVALSGEGYFEVAKDAHKPFKIAAGNTVVEVLGTHFNVKAYPDEKASQTSLLEGSVKVSTAGDGKVIRPGEQAIVGPSAEIKVAGADMEQVIAWKQGYFQFENEPFPSIALQLERWYDIALVYPERLAQKQFSGAIPRNSNLSQVLKILELSGSIKFKIEERRITVIARE